MGAKNELNKIYLTGSVVIAAVLGAISHSLSVFLITLILLIGINISTRKIR